MPAEHTNLAFSKPETLGLSTVSNIILSLVGSGGPYSHPWLLIVGEISWDLAKKLADPFLIGPEEFQDPAD